MIVPTKRERERERERNKQSRRKQKMRYDRKNDNKENIFGEYLCTTETFISTVTDKRRVLAILFKNVNIFSS